MGVHFIMGEELMALRKGVEKVWGFEVNKLPSVFPTAELTESEHPHTPFFTHCLWLFPCYNGYSPMGPYGHKA